MTDYTSGSSPMRGGALRFRRVVSVPVVMVVVAGTLSMLGTDAARAEHRTRASSHVLGYIESGDELAALRRNLPGLSSVGVDGINITSSGAAVSAVDPGGRRMLVVAHRAGKRSELLLGNYSDAIGDFDPAAAHRLFTSASNRRTVIAALVADVRSGWDGIHLDFESLGAADRSGLTRFTTQLRAALPARKTLSMAVMASTTRQGYRDTGYDLPALACQLTHVVLMAYDQHGPTWNGPGPIGGLPWAKQALRAMLASVPRAKVLLGVAGYGYTWPTHGTGEQLSDAEARAVAQHPLWDATQAEWHATLASGGQLWWSDARSQRVRRELACRLGLAGIAVWSLGLSDRITA
jgi:spore germination protein YaaH